jgi:hypothetical protein
MKMNELEKVKTYAFIAKLEGGIAGLSAKKAEHIARADALTRNIRELEDEIVHNYRKLERNRLEEAEASCEPKAWL